MHKSSGLEALGRAVLVKPYNAERLSTVIEIPDSVRSNMNILEQKVVVLDIGASAWHDEPKPRCVVGDHVIVTKFAGYIAQGDDGETYRLINDRDIFAKIEVKENSNG